MSSTYCVDGSAISPNEWGPIMWRFLFAAAQCKKTSIQFSRLLKVIVRAIPCAACKRHALSYIHNHPPPPSGQHFTYVWKFQNSVNIRRGRPAFELYKAIKKHAHLSMNACAKELANKLDAASVKRCNGGPDDMTISPQNAHSRMNAHAAARELLLQLF